MAAGDFPTHIEEEESRGDCPRHDSEDALGPSSTAATIGGPACPRCGFDPEAETPECPRCGVVFAKAQRARAAYRGGAERRLSTLDAEARRALIVGAVLALLVLALPFLRFVFSYLTILVHELGHAAFAWLFGYPALPSFDFYYGGGFTSYETRKILLLGLVFSGWIAALYVYRNHRPGLVAIGSLAGLYALFALTPLHEQLIGFMGHGTELVFAGIFFYRALSGSAVKVPVERPLYAFLAFFIVAGDARFALGLVRSPLERQLYADAKGGGDWMDFSLLARGFGLELTTVAGLFFILTVMVLPLTWLIFRRREFLGAAIRRVFLPQSEQASAG